MAITTYIYGHVTIYMCVYWFLPFRNLSGNSLTELVYADFMGLDNLSNL